MRWFRFYSEAIQDRKIRRLPVEQRWLWVAVLSAASESPIRGRLLISDSEPLTEDDLADMAAVPFVDVEEGLAAFERLSMLHWDGDVRVVTSWEERQPKSDNATGRWQKWKHQQGTNGEANDPPTGVQQSANVGEPLAQRNEIDSRASETDTETDTEIKGESEVADAPRTPPYEPEHYELAVLLDQRIQEHNPKAKPASTRQLERWANDARLMVERDEHAPAEIRRVITWCQESEFWRSNVMSMGKLREKFPVLWSQMHERRNGRRSPPGDAPYDPDRDLTGPYADVFNRPKRGQEAEYG